MFNAADRKDVRAAEKQAVRADRERQVTIRSVMDTKSGRLWFFDLLTSCHIFDSSFAMEAIAMAFKEGERNIGLQILRDLMRACPDMYVLMMREANERDTLSERRSDTNGNGGDQGPDPDSGDDGDGGEAVLTQ